MDVYDFGLRIKKLREDKGLSQELAGRKLGISRDSISNYERNVQNPKLETLVKMALLYNTSLDYLMGIDNRKIFVVDDLSESQQETVEIIIKALKQEFKKKD